jgi:methyltransferase (TIGR00027 family)
MNAVAITGLLVAAMRAEESKRDDRLFEDPFADVLAGDEGRAALAAYRAAVGPSIPIIEVRTRWYDDALRRAGESGVGQYVILAAGMDARAYRLPWPAGARVFEVDQPDVVAAKARALGDAVARCSRVPIGCDLAGDWPEHLVARGFDSGARTTWLVEGLLQYLDRAAVDALFARIDSLSAPQSMALYDVVGRSLLDAPFMTATRRMMQALGAPWRFGSDEPAALLETWKAVVTDPAVVGNAWNRWPFPAAPAGARDVPRGYLVEATKR